MIARIGRAPVTVHPFQPDEDGDCWCSLPTDNRCHDLPEISDEARAADARRLGERDESGVD